MDKMKENETKLNVKLAQRPKTKFEMFTGKATRWDAFIGDADKISSLYDEPNQKMIQLVSIFSPEITQVVLTLN